MTNLVPPPQPASSGDGDRWLPPGVRATASPHEPPPVDLWRIVTAARRRWWIVLLAVLVAGVIGWYNVRHFADRYTATAVIQLVDSRDALAGGLIKSEPEKSSTSSSILSQVEIIRSRGVANAVLDSEPLGPRVSAHGFPNSLLADVAVDERVGALRVQVFFRPNGVAVGTGDRQPVAYGRPVSVSGLRFTVSRQPPDTKEGLVLVQSRDAAIDELLDDLEVTVREGTNIIDISYTGADPVIAQQVVNGVAYAYQSTSTRLAQQQLVRRRMFIQDQLARTDAQLAEADRALSGFRTQQQAYSSQEKFKSQQSALGGLEVRRGELDGDRRLARDLLRKFQTGDEAARKSALSMLASTQVGGEQSPLPGLYGKLTDYQRTRAEMTSGPAGKANTHPDVQRLDTLIMSTQSDLIGAAQAHIALLDARIAALDEVRSRDAGALGRLPAAEATETRLQQNVDALRGQTATLRTEYQQALIAEAAEVGKVEIVDLATGAEISPSNGPRVLLFSLFLGLLAGLGLATFLEGADRTIKRRDEVEQALGVPVLGTIPRIDGEDAPATGLARLPGVRRGIPSSSRQDGVPTAIVAASGSGAAESFRQLGTKLLYSRPDNPARRILITSPTEGDGKTSIAANLAIAFAHQRHRVLLVDCDVYGKVHSLFRLSPSPGVSEVVLDGTAPSDVMRPSGIPGLSVMTSGKIAERTVDVIGSERMRAMLSDMAKDFDIVLLDCSPVLALADSTILSVSSDAVLLVVRAGHTPVAAAVESMRHLATVGARVTGVVLNDPDGLTTQYGGYYYGYQVASIKRSAPAVALD